MNNLSNVKIESERLLLIPISMEYKDNIFKEYTRDIAKYMYRGIFENIQAVEDFISKSKLELENGDILCLVVLDNKTQEFLGGAEIDFSFKSKKTPKLSMWLKKSAHGKGYGKEITMALKKWADNNVDYDYLLYLTTDKNIASCKIAESLGLVLGPKYEHADLSGRPHQLLEYRVYSDK